MRKILNTSLVLTSISLLTASAMAHPGHEGEVGMAHVMTSGEHIAGFLLMGVTAALLMLSKKAAHILVANVALGLFLILQGTGHAVHGGVLFGIETVVAGALLSLGAWRGTHMLYRRYMERRAEQRS